MILWLSQAVANTAIPEMRVVGWTWTTTVTTIAGVISGGTLAAVLKAIGVFQRNTNDRAKNDDERDGKRWDELMTLNTRLGERIDALEKAATEQTKAFVQDMAEERRRCDQELAEIRKDSAAEVAEIRRELAAVYRTISSANTANMRLFEPREDLPEDMKARLRSMEQGRRLDRSKDDV